MEYYFFVIIVIIILKILFWTFYFYVRAQRMRQARTTQRFIIVGTQHPGGRSLHAYNDRSAIIDHAEPVSVSAVSPPPYAEVVKDGNRPPSYDDVVEGVNTAPAAEQAFPSAPANPISGYMPNGQSSYPRPFVTQPNAASSHSQHSAYSSAGQR